MVYHILKDGSRPKDITGHIVKTEDAEALYKFLHNLKREKPKSNTLHSGKVKKVLQ